MELWIHLGGLLSTQEARVALGYASFVLCNLPCPSITRWLHAARLPFLKPYVDTRVPVWVSGRKRLSSFLVRAVSSCHVA